MIKQRKPSWQLGADNIAFIINELKVKYNTLDFGNITLLGHSHGGNVVIYFWEQHKNFHIKYLVTLDNSLLPLPRVRLPKIISLRSNDLKALPNVLPTKKEADFYDMKIVDLNIKHMDFCDLSSNKTKNKILRVLASIF